MSWMDKLFKQNEAKPIAAMDTEGAPANEAADAVATEQATGKIKLNFKKLPKKIVQAMADQTTGQTTVVEEPRQPRSRSGSDLMGQFNDAARDITDRAPLAPARAAAAPPRPTSPRGPTFSL